MQAIDGIDNGINLYDTDKLPRYANDTHLSARVGRLNPDWMDDQTSEAEDAAFRKAMSLTGGEFLEVIQSSDTICFFFRLYLLCQQFNLGSSLLACGSQYDIMPSLGCQHALLLQSALQKDMKLIAPVKS